MNGNNAPITALILTKNNASDIERCIDQVSWCRECIILDNGSVDETVALARKKKARVISSQDVDFSKRRNKGAEEASQPWLLYIDTDEEISDSLRDEIIATVTSFDPSHDPHGYTLRRENYYLGQKWPTTDGMIRLMYRTSLSGWKGKLHETAVIHGPIGELKCLLIHKTHRSLEQMLEKTNEWSDVEATLRLDSGHPVIVPWRLFRVFLTGFWNSYITQQGWKVGTVGLIESMYQGFSLFVTYAKLWEMQQQRPQ